MSRVVTCCVWLILSAITAQAADDPCGRLVTDALKSLGIADIEKFPPNRCVSTTGQAVNSLQGVNGDVAAAAAKINTALGNRDDPEAKTVQGLLKDLTGGDNPIATQLKKKADALEQTLFKMGLLLSADGSTAGQAVDSLLGMKGGVSVAADQIKAALGARSDADAKAAQDLLKELSNGDSAVAAQLGKKAETLKGTSKNSHRYRRVRVSGLTG